MGSILSKLYDDYDDYKYFCKTLNVEHVSRNGFYEHERVLLEKLGFKSMEDYYAVLNAVKNRDNNINDILND